MPASPWLGSPARIGWRRRFVDWLLQAAPDKQPWRASAQMPALLPPPKQGPAGWKVKASDCRLVAHAGRSRIEPVGVALHAPLGERVLVGAQLVPPIFAFVRPVQLIIGHR